MAWQTKTLHVALLAAVLAGCAVAPRGPANRPDLPADLSGADPRLVAALDGAANDGPAELDLTREAAEAQGFARLDAAAIGELTAGSVWRTDWRSGRIAETLDHRASGLRLDQLAFDAGFVNAVATAWYVDENGFYCETDASRRNCGPLYANAARSAVIWFNRAEPTGPFGTRYALSPGPAAGAGPTGPLTPAPRVAVTLDLSAGPTQQAEGEALIYRMVTRDEPGELSAAFSVPAPDGNGRCVALRHPSREAELICPSGLRAIAPTVDSGWPDEPAVLSLEAPGGAIATLTVGDGGAGEAAVQDPAPETTPTPATPAVDQPDTSPIDLSL
jgi:hypothetical protein